MKILDRLDRLIRPIAVQNLTVILIAGQVLMFLLSAGDGDRLMRSMLVWQSVMEGEVWRLVSFLFVPVALNPIWLFFALYIFYLMGTALEQIWGTVRYNSFLWLGAVLTILASSVAREVPISGAFLEGTVFLAFATYNPNFELRLFFVLPVKVKWLAYIQVAFYFLAFLSGPLAIRVMVLASVGNYLIFFGPQVVERIKNRLRRWRWQQRQHDPTAAPRHRCRSCGIDSNTDPTMDFRYCSQCTDNSAYCEEHLRNHEHVRE